MSGMYLVPSGILDRLGLELSVRQRCLDAAPHEWDLVATILAHADAEQQQGRLEGSLGDALQNALRFFGGRHEGWRSRQEKPRTLTLMAVAEALRRKATLNSAQDMRTILCDVFPYFLRTEEENMYGILTGHLRVVAFLRDAFMRRDGELAWSTLKLKLTEVQPGSSALNVECMAYPVANTSNFMPREGVRMPPIPDSPNLPSPKYPDCGLAFIVATALGNVLGADMMEQIRDQASDPWHYRFPHFVFQIHDTDRRDHEWGDLLQRILPVLQEQISPHLLAVFGSGVRMGGRLHFTLPERGLEVNVEAEPVSSEPSA